MYTSIIILLKKKKSWLSNIISQPYLMDEHVIQSKKTRVLECMIFVNSNPINLIFKKINWVFNIDICWTSFILSMHIAIGLFLALVPKRSRVASPGFELVIATKLLPLIVCSPGTILTAPCRHHEFESWGGHSGSLWHQSQK